MISLRRYLFNSKNITKTIKKGDKSFLNMIKENTKKSNKLILDDADKALKSIMETRLFSALPESWNSDKITGIQKFVSASFLSLLFTGGVMANYYDYKDKELSRSIISYEIHLLSSYLAFISGLQSGLQHYLGCGIVQKRFNWIPHYRQCVGITGVLAASFASGNSDVASKTVLYFLLLSYFGVLGNEYLFAKLKMAPNWYVLINNKEFRMKAHSPRMASGIFIGILLLLLCESQTLSGKTPEL